MSWASPSRDRVLEPGDGGWTLDPSGVADGAFAGRRQEHERFEATARVMPEDVETVAGLEVRIDPNHRFGVYLQAEVATAAATIGGHRIVLDSVAADEYAECRLKARFLSEADPGFQLFETMYATRENGVRHLERHLARIGASARYLGFAFDEAAARDQIVAQCSQLTAGTPHRMRLAIDKEGATQLTAALLAPLRTGVVDVLFAPDHGYGAMQAGDALLHHKTTRRAEYDRAWHEAESMGAFDMLFFNDRGELTEGGRSNVFVKRDGRWWTPPLTSGLLPGVMRGVLLDDPALDAAEKVLTREDVLTAQALLVCNALRGALAARLI